MRSDKRRPLARYIQAVITDSPHNLSDHYLFETSIRRLIGRQIELIDYPHREHTGEPRCDWLLHRNSPGVLQLSSPPDVLVRDTADGACLRLCVVCRNYASWCEFNSLDSSISLWGKSWVWRENRGKANKACIKRKQ